MMSKSFKLIQITRTHSSAGTLYRNCSSFQKTLFLEKQFFQGLKAKIQSQKNLTHRKSEFIEYPLHSFRFFDKGYNLAHPSTESINYSVHMKQLRARYIFFGLMTYQTFKHQRLLSQWMYILLCQELFDIKTKTKNHCLDNIKLSRPLYNEQRFLLHFKYYLVKALIY